MATDIEKKEYHQAHNLKKRCIKKHLKGIHDRFLKDPEFRAYQLEHGSRSSLCLVHPIVILMFHACVERLFLPLRPLHSLHLLSLHLSYLPALPAALHLLLP